MPKKVVREGIKKGGKNPPPSKPAPTHQPPPGQPKPKGATSSPTRKGK